MTSNLNGDMEKQDRPWHQRTEKTDGLYEAELTQTKERTDRSVDNMPDSVDVLDGITDLFPQLLLVKLHLRHRMKNREKIYLPQPWYHKI